MNNNPNQFKTFLVCISIYFSVLFWLPKWEVMPEHTLANVNWENLLATFYVFNIEFKVLIYVMDKYL